MLIRDKANVHGKTQVNLRTSVNTFIVTTITIILLGTCLSACSPTISTDTTEVISAPTTSATTESTKQHAETSNYYVSTVTQSALPVTPETTTNIRLETTSTSTITTPAFTVTSVQKPTYGARVGVGATAYDWFGQQTWRNPNALWDKIAPVPFLADHGFNWLRVGVTTVSLPELADGPPFIENPSSQWWCSREHALQVMKTGTNAGMHLNLFFYLSDTAAMAANQKAPVAWQDYSLEETANALKQHTFETTTYYKKQGLKIDLYEIGNEIELGICGYSNDTKLHLEGVDVLRDYAADRQGIWTKEAVLLKAAISGIKEADTEAKIVLHVGSTQYPGLTKAFFQAMTDFDVPFDYGGLSYYPWTNYHPEIPIPANCLELCIDYLADLGKKAVISEVSFPSGEVPSFPVQEVPGYTFTIEGQAKWISNFLKTVESNQHIHSIFYFYPDNYQADCGLAALFIDDKHPKPAIYEFAKFQEQTGTTMSPIIHTISLNTELIKNGNELQISAIANKSGLYVTADISDLDSFKTTPIMLDETSEGLYTGEMIISALNEATNGIKTVKITAIDNYGNAVTVAGEITLQNDLDILNNNKNQPDDTFDGTVIDVNKWQIATSGGGTASQNNRLILSTDDEQATSNVSVQSVWEISGDFDVQVDFQIVEGWYKPAKDHIDGASLGVVIAGQNYHITRIRRDYDGINADVLFAWSSNGVIQAEKPVAAISGKYRLVRVGTTLTLLYNFGNGWEELVSGNVPSTAAIVYVANGTINASQVIIAYFDNFIVNSGMTSYNP